MVVKTLKPGKFYGRSLPRPYIYTDVKHSTSRVDPPVPIMDPLMTWAEEAHWSMGGLNHQRHRLQGRIEGSVDKLRKQRELDFKTASSSPKSFVKKGVDMTSPSVPPAPVVIKRRRVIGLVDEEDWDDEVEKGRKRGLVRRLEDEFEKVAERTRSKKGEKGGGRMGKKRKLVKGGIRSSPRLTK